MIAQVLAVIIFLAMFVLIITEIWERHYVTLGCALLTLIFVFGVGMHSMSAVWETLNLHSFFTPQFWYSAGESAGVSAGINWETIVFVAGMMIMVEGMARVGFFRWLCMRLAKLVKYQVIPLFITFMVLAAFLSMFIDSITVILFLSTVTIELAQLLKFNPVPMILAEVLCKLRWFCHHVWRSAQHHHRYFSWIFLHELPHQYRCDCRNLPDCDCALFLCGSA